ncbi:MAG: phosphomannomutase/phosphoglucomutase [Patescibacteria group bacterium]
MIIDSQIFRDYDIRAEVPKQLDEEGVRRIAKAIVKLFRPKTMQVGRDMRLTSPSFHKEFIGAIIDSGVDVVDLGLISTDMLYFAAGKYEEDMAVTISASHNPPEYNGMKIVKRGSVAVSGDSGIYEIRDLVMSKKPLVEKANEKGKLTKKDIMNEWIDHLSSFIEISKMKPFKVVIDTGNGMAGHYMPHLEKRLPWQVTRLYYELDGSFPNHVPSPIEPENMQDTIENVKKVKADVGMAFDGDGDRVFLVDETGRIVSGTVVTAIIAENLLQKNPEETILYNAIVGRIVPEIIKRYRGKPHRVRVGHTLIKEAMRKYDGLFCGEHSGHYYFRANFYADSAIIAALLVLELMSTKNRKLSELVSDYDRYSASGEINFEVEDKKAIMEKIESEYKNIAESTDWLDGITVWFYDWWFNVRPSNTEPLLRLNIEADNDMLLEEKTKELVEKIESLGGKEKV